MHEAGLPTAATADVRRLLRECRDGYHRTGGGAEETAERDGEGPSTATLGPEEPLDLKSLKNMLRRGDVRPEAVRAALARAGLVAVARVAAVL